MQLCHSVIEELQRRAKTGSHEEGILVPTASGCFQPILADRDAMINADATYHLHGGTCEDPVAGPCYLEPPSVKDLYAFNSLQDVGVREHFIFGPDYMYHVYVNGVVPQKAFLPFIDLINRASKLKANFSKEWHKIYDQSQLHDFMEIERTNL